MITNDDPLPPLPPIEGSRSTKKKHGRSRGSRNKKKGYKRIRRETAGVTLAFETAFGHIPTTETPAEVANNEKEPPQNQDDDDVGIAVHMADREDDADEDVNEGVEDLFNDDEGNVGFGSPDFYDVKELIELSLEDADIGAEYESQDEVKQLKKDYIGKNSKISYRYSLINFLFYIFKFDKHVMHKSWIRILKTYDMMENEKDKEMKVKKMIRKLLRRADKNCPPIDFETYKPAHFFKYLLALENSDGKRFEASTYNL